MKKLIHLRLAIVLLDARHTVKGMALVEGQPRYALRKALEEALRLIACSALDEVPRLAILPAGCGVLAKVADRAIAYSKAGLTMPGLLPAEVREQGRRLAFLAWCDTLAEQVRVDRARCVSSTATRVA